MEAAGFLEKMRKEGLTAALTDCREALWLKEEEFLLLTSFSKEIGRGYRESELSLLDRHIEALNALAEEVRTRLPGRIRLSRTLLLSGGAALILLLL